MSNSRAAIEVWEGTGPDAYTAVVHHLNLSIHRVETLQGAACSLSPAHSQLLTLSSSCWLLTDLLLQCSLLWTYIQSDAHGVFLLVCFTSCCHVNVSSATSESTCSPACMPACSCVVVNVLEEYVHHNSQSCRLCFPVLLLCGPWHDMLLVPQISQSRLVLRF